MLNSLFGFIFQASLRTSLLIFTIFLLKVIFGSKMNTKWHTVIWAVVVVRLVIPWAPQSPLSLFNMVKPAEKTVRQALVTYEDYNNKDFDGLYTKADDGYLNTEIEKNLLGNSVSTDYTAVNGSEDRNTDYIHKNALSGPTHISDARKTGLPGYVAWIWLTGSVVFFFLFLLANLMLHSRLKTAAKLENIRINQIVKSCMQAAGICREIPVYETDSISSPMLCGIKRPVICLPLGMADTMTDAELKHIIVHEMIHFKKKDNINWIIVLLIRSIHWFNPLIHLAAAEFKNSNERYCDSMVLECFDEGENISYGRTLIRLAQGYNKNIPGISSALYGGAGNLEKRIKSIARFTKGACRWSIAAVTILALAACAGLSDEIDEPGFANKLEQEEIHIYSQYKPREVDEIDNMLTEVSFELSDSIRVTPVIHWLENDTYADEIVKLVKSGEKVDAFTTYGGYPIEDKDVFMDLTDIFPRYAPEYYSELTSHSVGLEKLKNCTSDGRLICIPNNDLLTERAFIIARRDLVEMFAPEGFETLEDYGDFLAQVKDHNPLIIPGSVGSGSYFRAYLRGNGYFEYQATYFFKKWDPLFRDECYPIERTDEFSNAYYMLKEWNDKGFVQRNFGSIDERMSNGTLASILVNGSSIDNYLNNISSEYEFVVAPLYMERTHRAYIVGSGVSVGATCTCPERVMMFLEWIHSSQESYDLFIYGIENRNYILNGDRISFSSDEFDIKNIENYVFFNFFRDFRYDRLHEYQPDGYKEIYRDACLKNIITSEEISEKVIGITPDGLKKFFDDQEAVQRYQDEYEKTKNIINKYFDNMKKTFQNIDKGLFVMEPASIIEMQEEIGIDEWLEHTNNYIKKVRGE
ncbi:MAG: M56 family metallopeptidase [Ruminiclostridium sp.]|nr:M56 family metallopeptidase [Ruminiclostridium sp.]